MTQNRPEEELSSIVNASGNPFQEAVEYEVNRSKESSQHRWSVLLSEHPWFDVRTNTESFIDLVLAQRDVRLIIECKRRKQARWVFLHPVAKSDAVGRARLALHRPTWGYLATDEFSLSPSSAETRFCSIRGTGEDLPWLERIAGKLVRSVDALALEEYQLKGNTNYQAFYAPIIVTNADLYLCKFDPSSIPLDTGMVVGEKYESVDHLRFRKAFGSRLQVSATSIEQSSRRRERTVFVVRATSLVRFLQLLDPHDFDGPAGTTAAITIPLG